MARVLGVGRISRETDESTSLERQRQAVEAWCTMHGHTLVDFVADESVSGAVAPWEREELGQWLPDLANANARDESRSGEWDVLCSWKLDRLSRRVLHVHMLHGWCKENGKTLASVADGYDLTTPVGEFLFSILASFAEMERETIAQRTRESTAHLIREGRWRGGTEPFGYKAEPQEGGGWRLVEDAATASVVREMVRRVLDEGDTASGLARWLNATEAPTPADAARLRKGRESKGTKWRPANITTLLRSVSLVGQIEHNGSIVRGDDGLPLERAEPLLDRQTWDRLQAALASRTKGEPLVRFDRAMLHGIAHCECGRRLYPRKHSGRSLIRAYGCSRRQTEGERCESDPRTFRECDLNAIVERVVLQTIGDVEVVERRLVPTKDHSADLRAANEALDALESDRAAGMFTTAAATERYRAQYRSLSERVEHLASLPVIPAHYDEHGTGKTYREMWEAAETDAERNKLLSALGLRVVLHAERQRALGIAEMVQGDNYVHNEGRVSVLIPTTITERAKG